jgi:hypothetical protein
MNNYLILIINSLLLLILIIISPAHRTATYRVWRYQVLYNTIW